MIPVEVHVSVGGETKRIGTLHRRVGEMHEQVSFEYGDEWLGDPERFPIDPELPIAGGELQPGEERLTFGTFRDSAPDSWGRLLMDRVELQQAEAEDRSPKTLQETDYLLGASDLSRQGALRFRISDSSGFLAPTEEGVPKHHQLEQLLESTARVEKHEETDKDLRLLLEPGSSLGGARPKASIIDSDGNLAIAKLPERGDKYSWETWEHVALTLAREAGINVASHELHRAGDKAVIISRRFDRAGDMRIPFMTAMTMLRAKESNRGSYPQIVDALSLFGEQTKKDAAELFRRMVFNIMITNLDDHLRNHGFLMTDSRGWRLSPAYDLNPVPVEASYRVLKTKVSPVNGACSLKLALDQAGLFGLHKDRACAIAGEVAAAVSQWKEVAAAAGESARAIRQMSKAFEHDDLAQGLRLAR